ncbi:MAG: hypothetical protein HUU35_09840, partial [Armatimonadetes bacterium]|nr:hypothetical protein [Armatimonadota bacterium]
MRRLSTLFGLLWVALATAQEQPLLLDGFEGMLTERWGKVATETELVKEGVQALRWDTVQTAHLGRTVTAASWGEYGGLGLWVHSARATGAPILMTLHPPDNPASEGGDYYHWRWVVDWEGWRRLEAPWSLFARAREPLAWELIERLELHAAGWGQDKPVPGTVLVLDQLELTPLAPEELARRLADRAAVEKGSLTPLGDGQMVLEQFGRGQSDLQRWESVQDNPADATAWVTEPLWYGIRLRRQGPGRLALRRAYDLDVAAYRTLVIRAATAGAAKVSVTALFDGETRLRAEADDRGLVTIPVQGARLLGLELVVEAEPAGRKPAEQEQAVDLEWIVLRPRENITASAHVFANRAVMLAWDRPWWGADRYFVARDRAPLARTDR